MKPASKQVSGARNMEHKELPTYVFATVNHGRIPKVVEELKRNKEIDLIAPVTGRYDLVLRLKHAEPEELYHAIKEIREIPDLRTTSTHTLFEGVQHTKKIENEMPVCTSLLNVEHKPFERAIEKLDKIPGLVEAFSVAGDFDILALWQGKDAEEIMKNTVEKVNSLEEFSKSETLLGRKPFFKP